MSVVADEAVCPAVQRTRTGQYGRLGLLLLCGAALTTVLARGFLLPFRIDRQREVVTTHQPLATVLGTDLDGALRFAAPVVLAFAVYGAALLLARGARGRVAPTLVLLGTAVFSLTLLPANPLGAHDVYHNIADARALWLYGVNPTTVPPIAFLDDPFFQYVWVWQDYASVYGPLWYLLAGAPLPLAGDALWPNVLGQKALTAAFLLTTTLLAMLTTARIRPGSATAAGVLVGWNPLLQFETAGNAHNDIVMVFFALATFYAVTRRWWLAVFPLLALSVASKHLLVLLGPVLLIWMLRRREVPRGRIALSLAFGTALAAALYLPFFAGTETLAGVSRQGEYINSSPGALLHAVLWGRLDVEPGRAATIMKLSLGAVYLLLYAVVVLSLPRDGDVAALLRRSFWAVFFLLLLVTWWFWPWYLIWLVPLAALLPATRIALLAAVFSLTAMLTYVPHFWLIDREWLLLQGSMAATAFALPVLAAILTVRVRRPRW